MDKTKTDYTSRDNRCESFHNPAIINRQSLFRQSVPHLHDFLAKR